MTDQDESRPRILTGHTVPADPAYTRVVAAERRYINDSIYEFVDGLPIGDSGIAPDVISTPQPDGLTCFYASLGGVAAALGRTVDVRAVAAQSRTEALLTPTGAFTNTPEAQVRQREFVRRTMGLNIKFIRNTAVFERVDAVTNGLKDGDHVIFGLPRHWVALDGIRKYGPARDQATWTGMNPSGGRRIEGDPRMHIKPSTVVGRLIAEDMPVVVVGGLVTPRFSGRIVTHAPAPGQRGTIRRATDPNPAATPKTGIRTIRPSRIRRVG